MSVQKETHHISRSRIGKKQIACFLPPDINDDAYSFALESGISRQALLALAVNRFMRKNNLPQRLSTRTIRLFRIPHRKRSLRKNAYGRTGKSALAGWYSSRDVSSLSMALAKIDKNLQMAVEEGIRLILGMTDEEIQQELQDTPHPNEDASSSLEMPEKQRDTEEVSVRETTNWEQKMTETEVAFPDF